MHHYVGATTMLIESGAEMRGRMTREPVSARTLLRGCGFAAVCAQHHAAERCIQHIWHLFVFLRP